MDIVGDHRPMPLIEPLRVIIGPTAAGKSTLALKLAEHRQLTIVSADSRQIYIGFDIGTGKPTRDEQHRVPHLGIDILSPTVSYSAQKWAEYATASCAAIVGNGRVPLIVGGTGFYVRALTSPLDSVPNLDPEARESLAQWLDTLDGETLARWCRRLDPARAVFGRTQHLRAVETALLTGRRLAAAFGSGNASARRNVRYLVIDPGPVLAHRIATRVQAMLDTGWMAEIDALRERVPDNAPAWKASGYETLRVGAPGSRPPRAVVERVIIETRQYAKRQRTWCRHQLTDGPVTTLDPDRDDALERALAWWDGSDGERA